MAKKGGHPMVWAARSDLISPPTPGNADRRSRKTSNPSRSENEPAAVQIVQVT
jgi:hypothetical protein